MSNQPPKSVKQHCLVVQYQFYLTIPVHSTMLIVVQADNQARQDQQVPSGQTGWYYISNNLYLNYSVMLYLQIIQLLQS